MHDKTQPSIENHETLLVTEFDQSAPCWKGPIIGYLRNETLAKDQHEGDDLYRSSLYRLEGDDLYRKFLTHLYQKCPDQAYACNTPNLCGILLEKQKVDVLEQNIDGLVQKVDVCEQNVDGLVRAKCNDTAPHIQRSSFLLRNSLSLSLICNGEEKVAEVRKPNAISAPRKCKEQLASLKTLNNLLVQETIGIIVLIVASELGRREEEVKGKIAGSQKITDSEAEILKPMEREREELVARIAISDARAADSIRGKEETDLAVAKKEAKIRELQKEIDCAREDLVMHKEELRRLRLSVEGLEKSNAEGREKNK
ncbi:hypothetical protein ACLOJK_023075 [Asimina triloba]